MDILIIVLCSISIVLLVLLLILHFTKRINKHSKAVDDSEIKAISKLFDETSQNQQQQIRTQLNDSSNEQFRRFDIISGSVNRTLQQNREETNSVLEKSITTLQCSNEQRLGKIQETVDGKLQKIQDIVDDKLQKTLDTRFSQLFNTVSKQLESIDRTLQQNRQETNNVLEKSITTLQHSNEQRLEKIQEIVDEKLQKTLDARLSQSFNAVSKQLESVQQGLGEMKNLAEDTKSLKNALINVKERGTYGEVRLEKLLSDILAPSQYETNVEIANGKRVEFVVKLPESLLPIDSKFPIEDYNRIIDANSKIEIDNARKSLTLKIKSFAKDIHDKYIVPPKTTDFALLFLPTEGLYAEIVQNASLFEELRDKYKVTVVGATTLSAVLSSLQIGFKTLAIEKRTQEVWDTLRAVKLEFGRFGDMLTKFQRQHNQAAETLEEMVGKRTRAINRTLRTVTVQESDNDKMRLIENEIECAAEE